MRCLSVFAALICLMSVAAAPQTQPSRRQVEQIHAHLVELVHPDSTVRETAQRALIEMGPIVRATLEQVLAKNDDPEMRSRVKQILRQCDGGAVVNGLKLKLRTETRKPVRLGESFTLVTEVQNTTDKPVNLYLGYSTGGVDFLSGAALHCISGATVSRAGWMVGFCGTGAGPLFQTIHPDQALVFELPATFQKQDPKTRRFGGIGPMTEHVLLLGQSRFMLMPIIASAGALAFRMEHAVSEEMNKREGFGRGGEGKWPEDEKARYWTGRITSNDVEVKLDLPEGN